MYLLLPLESLTSLLKISDISKRNRWRSRPLRIRVLGSHTWNASCRISSPWDSMFSSNPKDIQCKLLHPLHLCVCMSMCVRSPSSMLKCMASLALLGTLSMTSRPSLISPFPSSQHVRSSYKHKPTRITTELLNHTSSRDESEMFLPWGAAGTWLFSEQVWWGMMR